VTGEVSRAVARLGVPAHWYLSIMLIGSVVTDFVLFALPDWQIGRLPGVALVVLAYLCAATIAWWRCRPASRATGAVAGFLLLLLVVWGWTMVLASVRQEIVTVPALVTPVLLLMLWLKAPSRPDALRAGDALGWALLVVIGVSLLLEGHVPSFSDAFYRPGAAIENAEYWLPLSGMLGLDGRWAGPFVHPNLAGPVGAFLLVFGVTRPGVRRVLAALAGIAVLVVARWLARFHGKSLVLRVAMVLVPVLATVLVVVGRNPGMSGRTEVWPTMYRLWQASPVLGIGDQGFTDAIAAGSLPTWAHHAHNVVFDSLVRTGILGSVVVAAVLLYSLVIALRATRSGMLVPLALIGMLVIGGLTDTILHWRYMTVPWEVLLLAGLIAAGPTADPVRMPPPLPARERGSDPGHSPAPTP
jgi:O-antigen ligase